MDVSSQLEHAASQMKQLVDEEKFASMMLIRPNITIHPQEEIGQSTNIGKAPHRQVIRAIFDQFMGDITRPGQEKMLEYCYVEDYTTNEFSRELQQILQYDARLDELDIAIEEADNDSLEKELDFQSHSRHPKTILLVGNVGAGKSIFIHRFSRKAQPNRNICTIVDLINHSTKEIERNQAEEQRLAELIIDKLALEFRDKADPYSPEILRGCFEVEINRFRKQRQNLLRQEPGNFSVKEEEFIFDLSKDKYKHLVGYLKYIRKKRYRVWLALDNVDRGSESYQAFIYAFAHRLSADAGCVTLITLRQDTYLEAQEAGFLDVRSSDIIFQLTAPEFRQVVSKRRKFIEQMIERSETPRPFKTEKFFFLPGQWSILYLSLRNISKVMEQHRAAETYAGKYRECPSPDRHWQWQGRRGKIDGERQSRRGSGSARSGSRIT